MNESFFVDTSGLLCLHDRSDSRNADAISFATKTKRLLTTNYVLAEFLPLSLTRGHDRAETLSFVADLLLLPRLELVWVERRLHQEAMSLLERRLDKTYSLCDAVSFVLMRERNVNQALTTDKHFEQEGFVRLLPS